MEISFKVFFSSWINIWIWVFYLILHSVTYFFERMKMKRISKWSKCWPFKLNLEYCLNKFLHKLQCTSSQIWDIETVVAKKFHMTPTEINQVEHAWTILQEYEVVKALREFWHKFFRQKYSSRAPKKSITKGGEKGKVL